ncbi:MAG: ParB N-terminal domain-containing protein, partial [Dehalococcoidia bacterium]|nr:ParB N-terminal domain-containing protein [Dehalococcoidia bacterium]
YNVMKSPDQIFPHPENVKIYGDEKPDEGLIESIKENGILEMLIITEDGKIISGHRRWLAAKECGLEKIPCIIRRYDTPLAEKHEIVEHNRQREKSHIQKMREGEVHEEWEREQARRRQRTSGEGVYGGKPLKENLPEAVPYQSRDAVGAELGMSDFTY